MANAVAIFLLLVFVCCDNVWGKTKCCGAHQPKCFSNDYPFDDMPLPMCEDKIQPSMRLFTKANPTSGQVVTRTTVPPAFMKGKSTVFIAHGYLNWIGIWWMDDIKDAFLSKYDYNVILATWSKGAIKIDYRQAASNTRVAGMEIGLVAKHLVDRGLVDRKDLWCSGHSLGSHVCGHAGQTYKFGRITGMDPAGPWFEHKDWSVGINPSVADIVDIWHTNGDTAIVMGFGTLKRLGTVDYYPNGGGFQKGCIIDPYRLNGTRPEDFNINYETDLMPFCSHLRAFEYFEEAVKSDCQMHARQFCVDESNIPASCFDCEGNGGICGTMGMDPVAAPNNTRLLYLQTNGGKPYCMG